MNLQIIDKGHNKMSKTAKISSNPKSAIVSMKTMDIKRAD